MIILIERLKTRRIKFPTRLQTDALDCAPACLAMVASYYGKRCPLKELREMCAVSRQGTSLWDLREAASRLGFEARGARLNLAALREEVKLPCIVLLGNEHFAVVYRITSKRVLIADPAVGRVSYSHDKFQSGWHSPGQETGVALLLHPTESFSALAEDRDAPGRDLFLKHLKAQSRQFALLGLCLVAAGAIQMAFPFLTQAIVDKAIAAADLSLLGLILLGQIMLTFSATALGGLQHRIVLFMGAHLNIALIDDFLRKLIRLPMQYFDTRLAGDVLQRISDHKRLEDLATTHLLELAINLIKFTVFGTVLFCYQPIILLIFIVGLLLYLAWTGLFLRRRRVIDYERFALSSQNQDSIIQIVRGLSEIKLNNCSEMKISAWRLIQQKLLAISQRSMRLGIWQSMGSAMITQLTDIAIIFLAAVAVINQELTMGMMLAIQSIVGQLSGPARQLAGFIYTLQDVDIGLERLNDVYQREDETNEKGALCLAEIGLGDIVFDDLHFQYGGPESPRVIAGLSLRIPRGKVTAIVGPSGSGKTTLLKLLLGFYQPSAGRILINGTGLGELRIDQWRDLCGTVMQDGYIFSDTIAGNIALKEATPDRQRLAEACRIACIDQFIASLRLGYDTKVGSDGIGISIGQRQRLLIARAVYKNPETLIFDEATNSLDASSEKMISERLADFMVGRTAIVVAHRLSTVKNAHQIVVIGAGKIREIGSHSELLALKGEYYSLVSNQLNA